VDCNITFTQVKEKVCEYTNKFLELMTKNNDETVEIEGVTYNSFRKEIKELVGTQVVTPDSTTTFTNKTINDISNIVGANHIHYKVKATEDLVKGDVVKIVGYNQGEDATEVAKTTTVNCIAFGIVEEDLTNGSFGKVISNGTLEGLDTSAWTENTILYSDGAGGLTDTKPTTGTYQSLAIVLKSNQNNGAIYFTASEPVRTNNQLLEDLKTVDGSGSGLDADLVDGVERHLLGIGGSGYSVIDETANRDVEITYTNTTGKPILVMINIHITDSSNDKYFSINNTNVFVIGGGTTTGDHSWVCVIPSGATYKATSPNNNGNYTITKWVELK